MRNRRSGFTLLEMAIVVTIIALLIGALAAIRAYTRNAELSNTMNEAKFFITAFNQFQAQYNSPPGDYCNPAATAVCSVGGGTQSVNQVWPTAPNAANNGDGNGLIRAHATPTSRLPEERYYAWRHLSLASMIPGKYSGAEVGSGVAAQLVTNVPAASVKGVGFIFDHPDAPDGVVSGDTLYFDGMYPNVLIVAGVPDNHNDIPNVGFMTPKEALRLDEKFDDGRPGAGNMTPPKTGTPGTCTNNESTSAVYHITSDTNKDQKVCYFIIKVVGS